nr:E3 ubiquitin-protein ligase RNF169 [Pogona vitticeps]
MTATTTAPVPAERDFIFRAPITISKPGELHEEYKSQLRKWRGDRGQEERPAEDCIHKLIVEESDAGRKKTEDLESLTVKMTQEHFPERLSDSENEEPFHGKSAHRSAFVSKGNSYSVALLAGNLTAKVERSQSCNDTLGERSKSRQRAASVRAKVHPLTGGSAPLLGVLSSTQNNRCLSAPDLTADKRFVLPGAASFSLLPKPERSVSPESNDSISEELNHFKPIVCSPCTPPKRLPDGRVLSPLIIKSTPRNLTRSLQKPTTYEASPRILKKWEQIFQDRQMKKTLSKATLTSMASEAGEDFLAPSANLLIKESLPVSQSVPPIDPRAHTQAELECFPSICVAKLENSCKARRGSAVTVAGPPAPLVKLNKDALNARTSQISDAKSVLHGAGSCLSLDANLVIPKAARAGTGFPDRSILGPSVKATGRKPLKRPRDRFPNGICLEKATGEDSSSSSLRWGRKRQCKRKHLEQVGSVKRLRQAAEPPRRKSEAERKLQQEEEDRRLALELQRKFDSENRTVMRRKARGDHYFLRSKSTLSTSSA